MIVLVMVRSAWAPQCANCCSIFQYWRFKFYKVFNWHIFIFYKCFFFCVKVWQGRNSHSIRTWKCKKTTDRLVAQKSMRFETDDNFFPFSFVKFFQIQIAWANDFIQWKKRPVIGLSYVVLLLLQYNRFWFVLIANSTVEKTPHPQLFSVTLRKSLHSCCIKRKWYMRIVCDNHLFELHAEHILQWDNPIWLHFHTIKLIDLCLSVCRALEWFGAFRFCHWFSIQSINTQ